MDELADKRVCGNPKTGCEVCGGSMTREKLREIVGEAIGAASVCWAPLPEGTFCSTEAGILMEALLKDIEVYSNEKINALEEDLEVLTDYTEGLDT